MKSTKSLLGTLAICAILAGCSSDNDNDPAPVVQDTTPEPDPVPVTQTFEVNVVNLTAAQPFSPIALVAHETGYTSFVIGEPATAGLEVLAEGGDNSEFLMEAEAQDVVLATDSAGSVLPPGATETMMLSLEEEQTEMAYVSAFTMLVNTNDAITAARGIALSGMEVGDSISVTTIGYDAGTEANSESAGTIPGPADGGEGLNEARDDLADEVRGHPGVLTADDGLATSVLSEVHRWDNPIARVTVSRIE